MAKPSEAGVESLRRLKGTDPPSWLAPNPVLSETARAASQYLFSTLRPFSQKSPLDHLFVDGFDAEQIWQQIDLQSQPLLSSLRRRLKQLTKNPEEISHLRVASEGVKKTEERKKPDESDEESDGFDEELDDEDEDEDEEGVVKEIGGEEEEDDDEEEEEKEEGGESGEENGEGDGIEDKFLKIDELANYLEKEEENLENDDEEEENDDEDTEDDEDIDEAGGFGMDDDEHQEAEDMESARCLFLSFPDKTK